MSRNKKAQKATRKAEEKELYGNIVVVTVGCKQCPVNEEYRVLSREEADIQANVIGEVIECPSCHGKWILRRVQMQGEILQDTQEWRVSPMFVPILSSFDIKTLNIMDVPVAMIEDEKED